jgi:hypothetical protein
MGCNACRPSEPEAQLKLGRESHKNGVLVNRTPSMIKEDYNNFILLFENNLQYIGQYIKPQDFNSCIPENIQKYMIENPLDIKKELCNDSVTFEVRPIEFKNGNIYYGNWNDNFKMEGLGKYYLKEDKVLAEGIWENGDLKYARVFLPNGDIYEGEMKNSKFNGKGKLLYSNGDVYEGGFVDGEKNGNGKMVFEDKTVYEGPFEKGEFKGNGIMKWANNYEYNGEFNGLRLSGEGVLKNSSGDIYEGNFDNSLFNGKGKYKYKNGDIYEGEFQYGIKKGKGVYNALDKFEYNGDWDNDLPCGVGKLTNWNKNGLIKSTWRYGKIVEEPVYEKGTKGDFKAVDFNIEPQEMNLNTRELSHLELIDNDTTQYKIGTFPSFLEEN